MADAPIPEDYPVEVEDGVQWVWMQHNELRGPPARVRKEAFDESWSNSGWVLTRNPAKPAEASVPGVVDAGQAELIAQEKAAVLDAAKDNGGENPDGAPVTDQ